MTAQPNSPAPAAPSPATGAPSQEPAAAAPDAKVEPATSPWDDPAAAKAEIERLRRENGAARTTAKQQAAEEAKQALAQQIGKALGLVQDEPLDPTELTKQIAASNTEAQQAKVALAVYQAAPTAGGDPVALLDSSSFLAKVKDLDPSDSAGIAAAISAAVEANPRLGAAPNQPRSPRPDPSQGSGANGAAAVDPAAEFAAILSGQMGH